MEYETHRLVLRRPRLKDVPALFAFLGDAGAMRHTQTDASLRACRRRIAVHEWRRRRDGCAPWTVLTKADSRIVGWGGLFDDPFDPGWGIEVGYWFDPVVWGRGFATELVAASTDVADRILCLPEVRAFARLGNTASRRVLEKAGFAPVRFVPDLDRLMYRRRSPEPRPVV